LGCQKDVLFGTNEEGVEVPACAGITMTILSLALIFSFGVLTTGYWEAGDDSYEKAPAVPVDGV
jgi:hypothetical protein